MSEASQVIVKIACNKSLVRPSYGKIFVVQFLYKGGVRTG
jgi:hypothetical protein